MNTLAKGTGIWLPKTCGFIGGGSIVDAILSGFFRREADAFDPWNVVVADPDEERLDYIEQKHKVVCTNSNTRMLKELKIIILAVKSQKLDEILQDMAPHISKEHLIISLASGYPIERIESFIGADKRVIRAYPSIPVKVGAGSSPYCLNKSATKEDSRTIKLLLGSIGVSMEVKENMMDAVTAVCCPAYIFLMIEALADGAVKMGLPREIATKLASQTVYGSSKLLIESNEHPGVLKDQVTS